MYRKLSLKLMALISLLLFPIMFGAASNGYAGGPLPGPKDGGPKFIGNAVDGSLNAVVFKDQVVQYIVITCKENQVVLGPVTEGYSSDPANLKLTTAECSDESELCIEGLILSDAISSEDSPLLDCFPEAVPLLIDDLFITKVKNFINAGIAISAEVSLRLGTFVDN